METLKILKPLKWSKLVVPHSFRLCLVLKEFEGKCKGKKWRGKVNGKKKLELNLTLFLFATTNIFICFSSSI